MPLSSLVIAVLLIWFNLGQGENLTLFYNAAANSLIPNDDYGIAFNGRCIMGRNSTHALEVSSLRS